MKIADTIVKHPLWRHKKEVFLYICILVAVLGSIKAAMVVFSPDNKAQAQEAWSSNCYRVFVNGKDMGIVESREIGESAIKQAMTGLIEELGYDPEVEPEVRYYEEYNETLAFQDAQNLIPSVQQVMKDGIDVIKVKAYAMKIGEDFIVNLHSQEDVKAVLENAKNRFVSDDAQFAVNLELNDYNGLVAQPEIVLSQEALDPNRTFDTTTLTDSSGGEGDAGDGSGGKTVGAQFSEDIMVVETFVNENEISTVDQATELITKENEAPKVYVVQEGDCPSTIAANNGMDLDTLYALNPSMNNGEYVRIGDELTVMVPEPELSVSTIEEIVYTESIPRGTTYKDDDDIYVGSTKVLSSGSDGEKRITALVTKTNGKEVSRTITLEEVTLEPVDKVVQRGTKPLPSKGSTGTFILPLTSYVVSSGYGSRWGGFHEGLDLAAPTGTTIMAADGGTVIYAGWRSSYGYMIEIDHGDGVTTRYAHCSSLSVTVGQVVSQYQEVAKVGSTGRSTGPHCHFEILFDGVSANPWKYVN